MASSGWTEDTTVEGQIQQQEAQAQQQQQQAQASASASQAQAQQVATDESIAANDTQTLQGDPQTLSGDVSTLDGDVQTASGDLGTSRLCRTIKSLSPQTWARPSAPRRPRSAPRSPRPTRTSARRTASLTRATPSPTGWPRAAAREAARIPADTPRESVLRRRILAVASGAHAAHPSRRTELLITLSPVYQAAARAWHNSPPASVSRETGRRFAVPGHVLRARFFS